MKKSRSESGFALIMVIAVLLILTNAVVDLMFQTDITHTIASREVDKLQAFYLAKSGMNITKLFMVYNKKVEEKLESVKSNPAYASVMGGQPLYKMVEQMLSTAALRGMLSGSGSSESTASEEEESTEEEKSTDTEDKYGLSGKKDLLSENKVGIMEEKKVNDFLSFEGDFSVEISEEESKLSLNAVTKLVSSSSSYDMYKKILMQILLQPAYKNYFSNQKLDAETLTHAIFDYADSNSVVNEFDTAERGNEGGAYSGSGVAPKNAKYLTTAELRLIPGMNDDIFALLEPQVTVYTTETKVNVCLGPEELLDALIVEFTEVAECTSPIKSDETKKIEELREVVLNACADGTSAMAAALYDKLGVSSTDSSSDSDSGSEESSSTSSSTSTSTSSSSSSSTNSCKVKFENMITDSNQIFRFKAIGTVHDVNTTITEVVDTSNSKASKWKTWYYHVE